MAVIRTAVLAAVAALTCSAALPAAAEDANPLIFMPVRAEPEPGKVIVADWFGMQFLLAQVTQRPPEDDAEIIAWVRSMGDLAPPPLLMEMGRRLAATDVVEGSYWYRLGWMRTLWAGHQCADDIVFDVIISNLSASMAAKDPDLADRFDEPAVRLAAFERLGNGDAIFNDRVSAWWVCSGGAQGMRAALDAEPGVTTTVPLAEWQAPSAPRETYKADVQAAMPEWTAAARADLAGLTP